MEKNYAYELKECIRKEMKILKKEKINTNILSQFETLVKTLENTSKIKLLYKYRYEILNNGIRIEELEDVYKKLFKKIVFTDEKSVIFTEWTNVFTTIFGNLPAIYNQYGINVITKIVDMFSSTKNDKKLKLLMNLFVNLYRIENNEFKFAEHILSNIYKIDKDYVLDSYISIVEYMDKICNEECILSEYKEYILEQFSDSKSNYNSLMLSDLLEVFVHNEITNLNLVYLFKTFSSSDKELIDAYYELISNPNFIKSDRKIQNSCINILKNLSDTDFSNTRLITQIILDIIVVSNNEYIQDYLLEKLKHIKNTESLELLLLLTPVLYKYSNEDEYVRVIDSLEDKNNNLTKKLVINFDIEE